MTASIRKFLLINILLAILFTTTIAAIANYYLDQKDVQHHLDLYHPNKDLNIHDVKRNELGQRIALDDAYVLLFTFPLTGFLIWLIIGKGLRNLNRVALEVANRAPNHLEPVNLQDMPEEIIPVLDELNKLFFRLQEAFEREQRFAGDAAHELRTPLAAIKTQTQVALNAATIEEKNEALHKLLASVNRGTHIVKQLLTMSKFVPEATNMPDRVNLNLIKVTREILAVLAPIAIEKHIELELEAEERVATIKGNPTAIGILIHNLVDNSIRYCNIGGQILVRVYATINDVVIEVSDNGPGIPKKMRARVFERFFRVIGNTSPGSGLGLAIVQQICTLHGARIELSTPKKGSGLIVRVFFPKAK